MPDHLEPKLAAIVEAIQQLSSAERRQLQKRLQVAGLLAPDLLLSDQHPLELAPALGTRRAKALRRTAYLSAVAVTASPAVAEPAALPYRSPVSGRVVVGAPGEHSVADPHAMPPLPGQAPEQPVVIIFDGGSKGNPGRGYGSYAVRWPGAPEQIVQLQFGDRVTSNEAEYDTLIAALDALLKRLGDSGADAGTARLEILGDSALVINQVKGAWKCNEPRLVLRRDRVRELLSRVGAWQLTHHDRANSVKVLGH